MAAPSDGLLRSIDRYQVEVLITLAAVMGGYALANRLGVSGPLAMVLNVVGASVVPVGGGLSRAAGLVEYLDQALRARILRQTAGALAVPAQCGADAGLLGAALAGAAAWL